VPTEFYFEIQYFNYDWKITTALLNGHRNTQQWQVRLKSVLFRVRISNSPLFPFNTCFNIVHSLNVLQLNHKTYQSSSKKNWVHIIGLHNITAAVGKTPLCKIWKSADAEKVSIYTLTMWYWIFSEFKKIKIYQFYWMLNVQVLNSQSVIFLTLQSVLWMISEGSEVLMSK